jgi:hypothetical protein
LCWAGWRVMVRNLWKGLDFIPRVLGALDSGCGPHLINTVRRSASMCDGPWVHE